MLLKVSRIISDRDATLSVITVDGRFVCFGLEDEYREDKVPGETRIPQGRYPVIVRTFGSFFKRYLKKFPFFHRGMLEVENVPGFTDILIHIGNTDKDTAGCLLVGTGCTTSGGITITSSRLAYEKLYNMVIDEAMAGNLWIEYHNDDGVSDCRD